MSWARRGRYTPLRNCGQQTLTMAERTDAELFQVRVSELAENGEIDVVFSERRRVLSEAQSFAAIPRHPWLMPNLRTQMIDRVAPGHDLLKSS